MKWEESGSIEIYQSYYSKPWWEATLPQRQWERPTQKAIICCWEKATRPGKGPPLVYVSPVSLEQ